MSKVITLLGSTGSIGTQSLDVCRMHGYEVFGLSANSSVDKLLEQIAEFHPKYVAVTDPAAFDKLSAALAGQGVLLANEFVAARAEVLRQNLERMGVTNAIVTNEDTARLAAAYPGQFDRILVDAALPTPLPKASALVRRPTPWAPARRWKSAKWKAR